ncbi:hypothetical protein Tco_1483174 [Tanacetum coccineum]
MDEINNFQQDPDETLYQAWERFKELLLRCPQLYLTNMQEVILFYRVLDVPTRHILDSKGSDTSDGLAVIQAQLNNLSREIKKEEGKTLKEAYYTQYGVPFPQGGRYMAATPGFYQRDNGNPSYQERSQYKDDGMSLMDLNRATIPFPGRLRQYGNDMEEIMATMHSHCSTILDDALPPMEKDSGSFTLPCYINNMSFNKALADLGASVSVMPYSTFTNLGLGELAPTKLIVELANRTVKCPKGITENVLVGIDKFVFSVDFIVLDTPEDIKVPLILGRLFLSTAHAKIDAFERKITLRIRNDKIVFKSDNPTSNIIKKVYVLGLRERMELDLEARLMGEALIVDRSQDPEFGDFLELNDLNGLLELRRNQEVNELGFEHVNANFFLILSTSVMSKRFYNLIMKDKIEYRGKNVVGAFMKVPIFVKKFCVVTGFAVVENMNAYRDKDMGDVIVKKPFCRASCVEARRFNGFITIHDGNNNVTYQMARSHSRFRFGHD